MGVNRVSVGQVEELLTADNEKSEGEIARQLSNMELVERLSSARLSHLQTMLPGAESTQALLALADASAFLNSPSDEIPAKPIRRPSSTSGSSRNISLSIMSTNQRQQSSTARARRYRIRRTARNSNWKRLLLVSSPPASSDPYLAWCFAMRPKAVFIGVIGNRACPVSSPSFATRCHAKSLTIMSASVASLGRRPLSGGFGISRRDRR